MLHPAAAPLDEAHLEAHAQLHGELHGKVGHVPPELVATHLLRVTEGGDWPLRRGAAEALLRRVKAARESSEGWKVERRPRGKMPFGTWRVGVGHKKSYRVFVQSVEGLSGSCDCPDYARSSLALCKHLWWVLESCFDAKRRCPQGEGARPRLELHPVRALTGPGDWLTQVFTLSPLPAPLARRFEERDGAWRLTAASLATPAARAQTVKALLDFAGTGAEQERLVDVALPGLLRREERELSRRADHRLDASRITRALGSMKRTLFPYQVEGVTRFLEAGRLLLADDMGLGKTAQAIGACHVLHATKVVTRGLIIVPAALKSQWAREWALFSDVPLTPVDGPPDVRRALYRGHTTGFLVVNYEQVLKDLPELVRLAPEVVVLDEAQRIKNWAAKTSVYVKQLQPRWRLVLSGTPLENRLDELASLMEWVDDLALEPKWRLGEWHTQRADGKKEVVGVRNLDTLRTRLAPSMLRRIRREVLSQLPPRTDTIIPVPLTVEQMSAHSDYDQPIAQLMRQAAKRPLTQKQFLTLMSYFTAQRVICNGLAQRNFEEVWPMLEHGARPTDATLQGLFTPKLAEFRELLSNLVLTQQRKVVVFSAWKRMLRLAEWAIADVLAEAGQRAVHFTGDESQARRTQNVIDFHDDPTASVFFATDAGGVGLNLQRAASACIHLDLPWNPAVMEQRSGRVFRLGQTRPVDIYALVGTGGIEERIASIVGSKKALFDGLFDGKSDEVVFAQGGSFLERVKVLTTPVELPALPAARTDAEAETEAEDVQDAAPTPPPAPVAEPVMPAPARALLAGITVQRLEDGRMVLEAQPEAAATFAAMLEGVAALLKQLPPPR